MGDRPFSLTLTKRTKIVKQATLHQLQVFEAIAKHGCFTKAAEELYLTQPTVSQQMKQLTKAIGIPLFEQMQKRKR